ncbi:DUF934 domain-containing protein [Rhodovibrionaceae bacterium A322]
MAILKSAPQGWAQARDDWQVVERLEDLSDGQPALISLELWQSARDSLIGRNAPLGLKLESHQSPALLAEDLEHFSLLALDFPRYGDGRAYSYARLLRERYGFKEEIRAVGDVLYDQLHNMQRCGFTALEIPDDKVDSWLAAFAELSNSYQPTGDGRLPVWALRRQARVSAAE